MSEITIDVPDAPDPEIIYVTTLLPGYVWGIGAGLIALLIIAVAIVRYNHNEGRQATARRELEYARAWQCVICASTQVEPRKDR